MNRLRQVREKNEMLQRDVANFLGISTSAYGFYETGARSMSAETAKRLAKFFNVSVDYLLGIETANKSLLPVLGTVKAGYDYLAEENIIDYIDPSINITDPENYFGLIDYCFSLFQGTLQCFISFFYCNCHFYCIKFL